MTPTASGLASTRVALRTWTFGAVDGTEPRTVTLPHDAMISEPRSATSPGGTETGWFPGGRYVYRTTWFADAGLADREVVLRFEGVQGDADVAVNGASVGTVRSGYTEFAFRIDPELDWGAENEIVVAVDNLAQPASRWYPGSGLYRPVHLVVRDRVHLEDDGVHVRTVSLGAAARVEVDVRAVNPDASLVTVEVELRSGDRSITSGVVDGDTGTVALVVPDLRPWSAEDPFRYEIVTRVLRDGTVVDERRELVGLRTLDVDARHGLRVNGSSVKLRGACIHHDNGILGAATHRAAEYRRVRILKEAGFNALRSAHNPMSRDLLDACDELGMYVVDELADYWYQSKTAHDHAGRFLSTWQEDAARLVEKDRNRASVVMYTLGNEIPETATARGVALTSELTDYFHAVDPSRPVTVAVNIFLNLMVSLQASPYKQRKGAAEPADGPGSTEANVMVNQIGRMMDVASRLPRADKASRGAFAAVDVAGYNYGLARYRRDARAYPDRVILGSETMPGDVARAWELVNESPAVIGDFVWVGWEYLGESGVGVWAPGRRAGLAKPYPYVIAGPGLIDLVGNPDVSLRLAQAAWGTLDGPAIGVRPLDRAGQPVAKVAWRTTDAVESWSWRGCEGRAAEIEVYAAEDEVELLLNGRSLGRKKAGSRHKYLARFRTPYVPGELVAVGYRAGVPVSRTVLRSADVDLRLALEAESPTLAGDGQDLAFVNVQVVDAQGTVESLADDEVTLEIDGPAEIVAFGSAVPDPVEPFGTPKNPTYRGRALAVLRSTGGTGAVRLLARSRTLGEAELTIEAR
jgi:hypothetical protein